jgi:hypothetical protein
MTAFPLPPLTVGLDNVSPEGALPEGAARRVENVILDLKGGFSQRDGYAEHAALEGLDNLWRSPAQTRVLASLGNAVCTVDLATGATAELFTGLQQGDPVSYADVGPDIYVAAPGILRKIGADGTVRTPGIADLWGTTPTLAESVGGLDPGRYGVAYSLVNDLGEESPISSIAWITLDNPAGILVSDIQTADDAEQVRIYLTAAGGEDLYTHDTRAWASSTTIMSAERKRIATRTHRMPMPGGNIVRYDDGRLFVVAGNWIWISDPQDYGVAHLEHGWMTLKRTINVFEPVRGGYFVALRERTFFMRKDGAKWSLEPKSERGAFAQSGLRVPADFFTPEMGGSVGDDMLAVWLSEVGVAIGRTDGTIAYPQADRIRITGGVAKPSFVQVGGIKQLVFCVEDLGPGVGVAVDLTI